MTRDKPRKIGANFRCDAEMLSRDLNESLWAIRRPLDALGRYRLTKVAKYDE